MNTFDSIVELSMTILPIVTLIVYAIGIYLLFRLLLAMIRYYERLNREAKRRDGFQ